MHCHVQLSPSPPPDGRTMTASENGRAEQQPPPTPPPPPLLAASDLLCSGWLTAANGRASSAAQVSSHSSGAAAVAASSYAVAASSPIVPPQPSQPSQPPLPREFHSSPPPQQPQQPAALSQHATSSTSPRLLSSLSSPQLSPPAADELMGVCQSALQPKPPPSLQRPSVPQPMPLQQRSLPAGRLATTSKPQTALASSAKLQTYKLHSDAQQAQARIQARHSSAAFIAQRQRNLSAMQAKYANAAATPSALATAIFSAATAAAAANSQRAVELSKQQQRVLSLQRQPLLNAVKRRREEMLHTTAQLRKDFARCLRDAMRCVRELEKKRALQRAKTNKALQREREQRLAALKNNDMAAYTALLANCKTARLRTLLEQTAQWERKLADMIETKRSAGQRDERQQRNALAREARLAAAAVDAASASAAAAASASSSLSGSQPPSLDVDEPLLDLVDEKVAQPAMLSGGTLTPYQLIGLQWLVSLHNNFLSGVLADEMGLGKTIQTIALIAHLLESKRDAGPYLIVAPKSTLANWAREFAIWAPKIRVVHYSGSREERAELWKTSLSPGTFHVLLVNFELIYNAHDVGKLSRIRYKYVVLDEGHRVKNAQSKLALLLAAKYKHVPHRLILSGTPLQNNLRELWSLLNFLLPSMFDCAESFDEWFSRPFENQGLVAARNNNDADEAAAEALLDEEEKELIIRRLHSILRPFLLRREKKDVATELPAKTECVLQCALSPWQTRLYERIQSDSALVTVGADGVARIKQLHNTFMQLRKIAIHPYLFEETDMPCTAQMHRCSGKFVQLHRMLPKLVRSGHRVLLFSQMTRLLDILDDYLRWRGLKFVRLDGSSSTDERAEAQQLFNAPGSSIPLFILSTKAGGLGLNLQTADTVILIDSAWNPFEDRQAMDRAHRIGSKNEVRVIRLISRCPVEEQMLSRAQEKLRVDELIIQSGRFDQNSSAEERKSLLQTILRQRVRSSHEAPAPTDIEVNRLLARTEEEFEAFQRMDQALEAEDVAAWADEPGNKDKPWPGRLLTEAELPAHIKEAGLLEQLKAADALNDAALPWRRAAASFKLNPADSLTERQWMRCLERGVNPVDYALSKLSTPSPSKRRNNSSSKGRGQPALSKPASASSTTSNSTSSSRSNSSDEKEDEGNTSADEDTHDAHALAASESDSDVAILATPPRRKWNGNAMDKKSATSASASNKRTRSSQGSGELDEVDTAVAPVSVVSSKPRRSPDINAVPLLPTFSPPPGSAPAMPRREFMTIKRASGKQEDNEAATTVDAKPSRQQSLLSPVAVPSRRTSPRLVIAPPSAVSAGATPVLKTATGTSKRQKL